MSTIEDEDAEEPELVNLMTSDDPVSCPLDINGMPAVPLNISSSSTKDGTKIKSLLKIGGSNKKLSKVTEVSIKRSADIGSSSECDLSIADLLSNSNNNHVRQLMCY